MTIQVITLHMTSQATHLVTQYKNSVLVSHEIILTFHYICLEKKEKKYMIISLSTMEFLLLNHTY
jgi:hypothetical protein